MNKHKRVARPPTELERLDCIVGQLDLMASELELKVMLTQTEDHWTDGEMRELETACIALVRAQARLRRVTEGALL